MRVFSRVDRDRLLEGEPAFQRPRLLARPGADLRLLRPASRNRHLPPRRSRVQRFRARAPDDSTTSNGTPARLSRARPTPAPFGCPCWCRRRIRAHRSPSAAPFGRWACRLHRRSPRVMAVGSRGSAAVASFSQAANSRKGSSAAVKSPLVNQVGCSIEAVSDITRSARVTRGPARQFRRCLYNGSPGPRLWRAGAVVGLLAVALARGGCSMSYQLNSLGSMFGGGNKSDITGSITPPAGAKSASRRRRPTTISPMPRPRSAACSRWAANTRACPGRTPRPARAAPSRRSPRPIQRRRPDLPRFPGELRQGRHRKPGCRAKPASTTPAPGWCAR